MVPAGSIVQIDTRQRAISSKKYWAHEFQRPIYFLMTRECYVCGWCELDRAVELADAHPASPVACIQPQMEVPRRDRERGARDRCGYSVGGIARTGRRIRANARIRSRVTTLLHERTLVRSDSGSRLCPRNCLIKLMDWCRIGEFNELRGVAFESIPATHVLLAFRPAPGRWHRLEVRNQCGCLGRAPGAVRPPRTTSECADHPRARDVAEYSRLCPGRPRGLMRVSRSGVRGRSTQHPLASSAVSRAYGERARGPLGTYNFSGDLGKATLPPAVSLLLTVMVWSSALCVVAGLGVLVAVLTRWLMPPIRLRFRWKP